MIKPPDYNLEGKLQRNRYVVLRNLHKIYMFDVSQPPYIWNELGQPTLDK